MTRDAAAMALTAVSGLATVGALVAAAMDSPAWAGLVGLGLMCAVLGLGMIYDGGE